MNKMVSKRINARLGPSPNYIKNKDNCNNNDDMNNHKANNNNN